MSQLIYVLRNRQQEGPFVAEEVGKMLEEESIWPSSLAWTEGLENWIPLSQIPGLELKTVAVPPPVPQTTTVLVGSVRAPGIGRAAYFGLLIAIIFFSTYMKTTLGAQAKGILDLLIYALVLVTAYSRLQNAGYSGWMTLLAFVPVANFYIGYLCLAAPQGYAQTKKLDKAGVIVCWIFIGCFILTMGSIASILLKR